MRRFVAVDYYDCIIGIAKIINSLSIDFNSIFNATQSPIENRFRVKIKKGRGDRTQPFFTPFSIGKYDVNSCPTLTDATWFIYRLFMILRSFSSIERSCNNIIYSDWLTHCNAKYINTYLWGLCLFYICYIFLCEFY